jgi:hypothetical protein
MKTELASVPGTPETELTPDILARLPADAPPAPWRAGARTITWWARPDRAASAAARDLLPHALSDSTPLATIGTLVSYTHTPVGPYDEIVGILLLRRGRVVFAHVPFIAVSSPASVVGGRANWALPKTLATFEGQPVDGTTMTAQGAGWQVTATARARGPAWPFLLPALADLRQVDPNGGTVAVQVRARGRCHLAHVTIAVSSDGPLATWLPHGERLGLLSPSVTGYFPPTHTHTDDAGGGTPVSGSST